ncbi:hypothetical protein A9G42_08215 [Gilliamella sp. Nev6-6]|uniref:restriction endonuclease subunit S n=1 Tax=Gilliamella sp. Nev6-6 TaxID=3120252 RepID=UPI00080F51D1|nr:restriction endonuclease subunit S [Gilliamella apicola]OCG76305.1 hypothetical protein A9G42_08215 [Gilliamella apicola]
MSQSKKLIPRRRFREFEGASEWQRYELGQLGCVAMNRRIFKEQTTNSGEIPFYKIGTFGGEPDAFISREIFEKYKAIYPYPKIGDILISASGSIGKTIEYEGKDEYFQDSNIVWLNHDERLINSFLKQFYKIVNWQGIEGSTIKRLYNKNILLTEIILPSAKEQTQIGEFFKKLDNLINTQQKKLEKAKTLKSAYLREMFPNEGELKPRLRFNSFINAWHIKDINDLANRYDNFRIPITASNRKIGLTPYYGANGIQDYVQGFTHDGEYILIAEDGANDFKNYPVQYVKGKIWVNNHAHVLQGKIGICDNKFLMNAFKNINIEPYLVGGSRAKLNSDTMMNISLKVPNQQEQTKIGNFFKLLDDKIALEQKKLDKLKHIKQAYLNEMFV